MARFINVRQEGTFRQKGKNYIVEMEKKSGAEIYNFYIDNDGEKGTLTSSVFNRYLSKAVGVKKAGEFEREVFGNFETYLQFQTFIEKARHRAGQGVKTDRKLIMDDVGGFIDVVTRETDTLKHVQHISEGNVISESIMLVDKESGEQICEIDYACVAVGTAVKARKEKGIEYIQRESGESDLKVTPVKTIDMIALEKDLSWMERKSYHMIKTEEKFEEYLDRLDKYKGNVGFDTETTGLKINRFPLDHPHRDNLVGICLSIKDDEGVYIPIRHKLFENLDEEYVIEKLRPYLDANSEKKKSLVTHYGSFDWKVMWGYGIDLNIENDTYILQYMLNNSEFRGKKTLESLALAELDMDMVSLDDMFIKTRGRKLDMNFAMLPEEPVRHYAPADADATRLLFQKKIPELPPTMRFLYWIEVELMKNIAHMEYYGMRVDIDKLVGWLEVAKVEKDKLMEKMTELVGREFNPNSTKEMPKIMYEELGYPVLRYTDKGAPSTGKHALKLLSKKRDDDGNQKYPLAKMLSDYKKQEKLITGFLEKMLNENIDGYIFPHYNQTGTDSGRISCSGPNLQQSPGGDFRATFRTDSDDYYFLIVDYSQVEYRIMAGLANEIEVIDQFEDPEADYHVTMYARMNNKNMDEVTSAERSVGKVLNFGLTYGMGPYSLALTLFSDTSDEKVQEAKDLGDIYWDSVPNIRDMLQETKDRSYLTGYVETKFGRRRYFPEIRSDKYYIRESNMRRAANTRVQGTGADILKIAHVKVERKIKELELDAMVKLSMHDELVLQVNKDINPWKMIKIVRECMELKIKGFPPLYIGANVGNTWAAGKRDDLEIPVLLTDQMIAKGEHKNPGYTDPEKEVEMQIKEYMLSRLTDIIQERNLNTVEKIKSFAKSEKIIKDYFGGFNEDELIQDILDNKPIELEKGFVVYSEEDLEFGDESDEDGIDGVEAERMSKAAAQRMGVDKDKLELDPPKINTARKVYESDYRVMVHDKKCFIRLEGTEKGVLNELVGYLKTENSETGNQVVIVNGSKIHETAIHLYRVDKLKLLMILDKYTKKDK